MNKANHAETSDRVNWSSEIYANLLWHTFLTIITTTSMPNFEVDVHITIVLLLLVLSCLFIPLLVLFSPIEHIHRTSVKLHISCAFVIIHTYMALVNIDCTYTIMFVFLIISLVFVAAFSYKFVRRYKIVKEDQRKASNREEYDQDVVIVVFLCALVLGKYIFYFTNPEEHTQDNRFVIPDCLLFFSIIMGTIDMMFNLSPLKVPKMDDVLKFHCCAFSIVTMVTVFAYSVVLLEELAFLELIPQLIALSLWLTKEFNPGLNMLIFDKKEELYKIIGFMVAIVCAIDLGNMQILNYRTTAILFGSAAVLSAISSRMLKKIQIGPGYEKTAIILEECAKASLIVVVGSAFALAISNREKIIRWDLGELLEQIQRDFGGGGGGLLELK